MTDNQLLLIGGSSFVVMIIWGMKIYRKKWNKLFIPFPTELKLPVITTNRQAIKIDNDHFKKVTIEVLPDGLLMAQYGLLPRLFIPGHVLIPWKAFSPLIIEERALFSFAYINYHTEIKTSEGLVKLMINKDIGEEISKKGYLKN